MPNISWLSMHGALTHFPIAMLIAGALFDLGAVLFKKNDWRPVGFWLLVTAVVSAVPSLVTGWVVGGNMYGHTANPPQVFTMHRLAAFVVSGLALLFLLWRIKIKDNPVGPAMAVSLVGSLILFCGVSYTGYLGGEMTLGEDGSAPPPAVATPVSTASQPKLDPALVAQGKLLYSNNGCSACHRLNGDGGKGGPDLSHEGSIQPDLAWQAAHLKNPAKLKPGSTMPPYDTLSEKELAALSQYLVSNR